ncbi:MAG: hypothetical protein M1820_009878 [Bogoriella megaspora]|nr:MAG: hypothetical protein M1820_009878 [Bogoriella megaspora]
MVFFFGSIAVAATFLSVASSAPSPRSYSSSNVTNAGTSLTFLYQNNLNASDDANHVGAILLDPTSQAAGAAACSAIGESLLPKSTIISHLSDFQYSLSYVSYAKESSSQRFYIADGVVVASPEGGNLTFPASGTNTTALPILCTQSSNQNGASNAVATSSNEITITSTGNTFVGFRNQKSFRFNGIPYADRPQRFEYSSLYSGTGQTINATSYGADCQQGGDAGSSENCLFLNIQTPYIPKAGSNANLRPVLFSIHGGGFTGGNGGANSGQDGGNLASREDIVSVEINYRLSTLGFLAIPGTSIKGNFGISDQVTALKWVKRNIAQFGGDPNKVTIIGESAGAGSVRTLLGSPPVISGKLIAGGISQSNLGGGQDLGLNGDYATTYSSYYTISESYAVAGQQIFQAAGCNQSSLDAQIACLKTVSAATIVSLPTVARYVVQDGTFVNTEQLDVTNRNGSSANVPIIFGTTANDGASFCSYPPTDITSEVEGIAASLSISQAAAQSIIDSGLFPYYDTGNLTLDTFNVSQRVSTDIQFRCIDEATVYAASVSKAFPQSYYYTMDRTYQGYDPDKLGTNLSAGPIEPGYPYGNPEVPYFRLHGSDLGFTYGNQYPLRDEEDLQASQLISGYFAEFAKSGQPNPSTEYLRVRGYQSTLEAVTTGGSWDPVSSSSGPSKSLTWPSLTVDFPDLAQCAWLNYSVSYYLEGGT